MYINGHIFRRLRYTDARQSICHLTKRGRRSDLGSWQLHTVPQCTFLGSSEHNNSFTTTRSGVQWTPKGIAQPNRPASHETTSLQHQCGTRGRLHPLVHWTPDKHLLLYDSIRDALRIRSATKQKDNNNNTINIR